MATKHLALTIYLFVVFTTINYIYSCKHGVITGGRTDPCGDITLQYGQKPLDIVCNLDDTYLKDSLEPSLNLSFQINAKPVPKEFITRLNSTSIQLHIEKPPKQFDNNYLCLYNEKFIGLNVVSVGVPPQNVTDFHCKALNFENLTCIWTEPNNYINTDYDLKFKVRTRASRLYNCPDLKPATPKDKQRSCFYNISTDPQYRQGHDKIFFYLNMSNIFGTKMMNYTFNHFEHVLPNAPEDINAVAISPDTISLSWFLPTQMRAFPRPVDYRILYQCEYDDKNTWHFAEILRRRPASVSPIKYNLTNLPYGHSLCDIRVSVRSSLADPKDEDMWSNNASTTVRTLSKIPENPPKTTFGNFEIINKLRSREVKIYWQQIREEDKNGPDFNYTIEWDEKNKYKLIELTKLYAQAQISGINKDEEHRFKIYSVNRKGKSKNYSTVFIPKEMDPTMGDLYEQLNFMKIALNKDGLYGLQWALPKHIIEPVRNFTLFWCESEKDRPYPCDGILNWHIVSNTTTSHNISVKIYDKKDNYQFAIAVNTEHYSSGLIWAECTVLSNGISKLRNVRVTGPGSTYLEVQWKFDCSDRNNLITGYRFLYCKIVSPSSNDCLEPQKNITISGDAYLSAGNITGLIPYTTYRIIGAIISKDSVSQLSHPIYYTTLEAAPTPPTNVKYSNVTNSSVTITWNPPEQLNGVVKYYLITYNGIEKRIDTDTQTNIIYNNGIQQYIVTLTDLKSYVTYLITIQACTVACSNPKITNVTTFMGYPGVMKQPQIASQNDTRVIVTWEKPEMSRGKINYYEIRIKKQNNDNESTDKIYNVTGTKYETEICNSETGASYISVRAVNIINNTPYKGPWSEELVSSCRRKNVTIIIVSSVAIFIVMAVLFACKKLYRHCKIMRDVEVKLPPGLTSGVEVNWPTEKNEDKCHIDSPPDEQSLLDKNETEMKRIDDSSGCSSGHESVTSSLETTTHLSSSDSGTEQPRSSSSEEMRRHSLRQRNVGAKTGYLPFTDVSKPTQAGSYCQLGVDPTANIEPSDPYVQAGSVVKKDLETPNQSLPAYIMSDLIKTPNPSYVPFDSGLIDSKKNPGYVIAGRKDVLVPELIHYEAAPVSVDDKPYVKASDAFLCANKPVDFQWSQTTVDQSTPKTGYVSVGEAQPPSTVPTKQNVEHSKGYIPHRQFEAKSLKED